MGGLIGHGYLIAMTGVKEHPIDETKEENLMWKYPLGRESHVTAVSELASD
jgi:hypothetical protein